MCVTEIIWLLSEHAALMFCIDPCLRGVSLAQQSSSKELKKECADVLESLKVCTPSSSSNVLTVKCRCNQWHSCNECNDVVETRCCIHSDTKEGHLHRFASGVTCVCTWHWTELVQC